MKDIEKLLQEELSNIVPPMSEELRNHPITSREKKPMFIPWKLVISVCSLIMIAVLAISLSILNPSTPGSQIGTTTTPTETIPVENEYSYYLIQINPKILIKTNNGEVLDAKPLNEDASKFLENIKEIIKNSEIIDSINIIAQKAVEKGYISHEESKTINISAIEGSSEEIFNCITNAFKEYFTNSGFDNVLVDKNDDKITIEDYCKNNNIDIDDFDQYFENLPMNPGQCVEHSYMEEWTIDKEPTCTEDGIKSHHCLKCEERTDITIIEAIDHSYESEVTLKPTCEETGIRTYTCACGDTYTEVISAPGHNIISHDALAPTCEEPGHNAYEECTECDYTTYESLPALNHDYEAVVTEPTCTTEGYTTYICKHDRAHTYVDNYVEALDHKSGEAVVENRVEPTEAEDGHYDSVIYCNECNDELSRETIIIDKLEPSITPEEIEDMYNEELSKYTYNLLVNNINIIEELNDIVTIINDNSNSMLEDLFQVNYWEIDDEFREFIESIYPDEIEVIKANINRYKEITGSDITSLDQFNEIYNTISSLKKSQIENLISQYESTGECLITAFTTLDSLINVISLYDEQASTKLYNAYNYQKPTTMDEYNEFLNIIK